MYTDLVRTKQLKKGVRLRSIKESLWEIRDSSPIIEWIPATLSVWETSPQTGMVGF
jgi:hypothetical protein